MNHLYNMQLNYGKNTPITTISYPSDVKNHMILSSSRRKHEYSKELFMGNCFIKDNPKNQSLHVNQQQQ